MKGIFWEDETNLETEFGNSRQIKIAAVQTNGVIMCTDEINTCATGQCAHGAVVIITVNQTLTWTHNNM